MPSYSQRSLSNLSTCHPDLQRLFGEVIKHFDCTVIEGHRGREEQERAVREGKSNARWGQSKHNTTPSLASDVIPYSDPIDWDDYELFRAFGGFVLGVASQIGVRVRWGGDWDGDWKFRDQSLIDLPHFELTDYGIDEFMRKDEEP